MDEKTLNAKNILKATLLSLIISMIFIAVLAVIACFFDISDSVIANMIFIISAVSVLTGAFILAKNAEQKGLLNGLLLGAGYFLVILAASLLMNGRVTFNSHNLLRCFSIIASGMLGGVLGINTKKQ